MDLPLDLEERLRSFEPPVKTPAKRVGLPRHRKGEKFVKGPIPIVWLQKAGQLPGKAMGVAMALWFQAGMQHSTTVKLSTGVVEQVGLRDRRTVSRGLANLEGANLVSVVRHPGRCPLVTIKDVGNALRD